MSKNIFSNTYVNSEFLYIDLDDFQAECDENSIIHLIIKDTILFCSETFSNCICNSITLPTYVVDKRRGEILQVYLPNSCDSLFKNCSAEKINLNYIKDTSNIVDMSKMFKDCTELKEVNVSNLNTKNVYSMRGMFSGCHNLQNIDVTNFDTSMTTNMSYMFYDCRSLKSLYLVNFNMDNVKYVNRMFNSKELLEQSEILNNNFEAEDKSLICIQDKCN